MHWRQNYGKLSHFLPTNPYNYSPDREADYNHTPDISHLPSPRLHLPKDNCCFDFYSCKLIFLILELYMNGIILYSTYSVTSGFFHSTLCLWNLSTLLRVALQRSLCIGGGLAPGPPRIPKHADTKTRGCASSLHRSVYYSRPSASVSSANRGQIFLPSVCSSFFFIASE